MPKHVRKGDQVMVTAGSHKGTVGEIMTVIPKEDKVLIKGVNLKTRHVKPTQANPQGGIVTKEGPIHISNVSPVVDGKPSRVRFKVGADGSKERIAARDGSSLGKVRGPRKAAK